MMKCQSFQLLTYQEPLKHLIFNLKYNRRVLLLFKSCWPKAFYFSVCGFACKNAQKNCFQREVQITTFNGTIIYYCHTMLCFIIILTRGFERSSQCENFNNLLTQSFRKSSVFLFSTVVAFTKIDLVSNQRKFIIFSHCVYVEGRQIC